ncbi:MAG: hypothetical protein V1729_06750 [Candidatus Woesearchaeota archaeon]
MDSRLKINGKLPRSRIVIASGCRATTLETILNYSDRIPGIGIFTTKSIGPAPNAGNPPPIYCAAFDQGYLARRNAVGLANPGIEEFEKELAWLRKESPDLDGALLLGSAYGSDIEEMLKVCRHMAPYVDAIELNFSCPHARGYGLDTGRDADAMARIVSSVQKATGNDVFAKLSPNLTDAELIDIAKACVGAGARGLTLINTADPGEAYLPGTRVPILFNRKGGLSGEAITQQGFESVNTVREAVGDGPLIIGMGGVRSGDDVRDYIESGADLVGIGTVMEGMDSGTLADYVRQLDMDISNGMDEACYVMSESPDLEYIHAKISSIEHLSDDLRIFHFDDSISADPCQYLFLAVPGDETRPTMEAPFSIPIADSVVLAVRRHDPKGREHHFTSRLWETQEGDVLFMRGPYGVPFKRILGKNLYLVGGGTGSAALASIAERVDDFTAFIGAKSTNELLFEEIFNKGDCYTATEVYSPFSYQGYVTDLFEREMRGDYSDRGIVVTCGPTPMMQKVVEIANRKGFPDDRIHVVMEPYMKCGVGICGSCSDADGNISCTDGHIMTGDVFKRYAVQGKLKRNACGGWER